MGHVDHEMRADLVRDAAEGGEVDGARIGGSAGDDQPGPGFQRPGTQLLVVDPLV